ncbi:hypothetical protein SAMN05421664_0934 [Chryseobacterium soldanellicola]|uniref:Lipoprotein n=1 Tax=Chryseobacterium soldanellicola TaxID=311333 RepID=A0A1H0YTW1_9FLAO|nr:hypothetical protein [Chryseobacterium soldanellicola]SDQ18528.1 hypothetical protein SAMN05421664_0934 [Chryseobacterium soldanellicola]
MKKIFPTLFLLLLFSCKGEFRKDKKISDSIEAKIKPDTTNATKIINNPIVKSESCYDYLTELVRSSNFPFSNWSIQKEKVNLEIDEDNEEYISAKLFFDTDGTGTIGWINYYKKTGKLFDTSANLEKPKELKFDSHWKKLFDECVNYNQGSLSKTSLESIYNQCKEISLPNKYSFDAIPTKTTLFL